MLNQGINVPDNTIAVFLDHGVLDFEECKTVLKKPDKKREWFDDFFYKCLPLTIGNQYGFVLTTEYDFDVIWNGGNLPSDLQVFHRYNEELKDKIPVPMSMSHFGHGIFTIAIPFVLRTPPGVNLMTINPPNHILKNVTAMTGVVETDNLRMPFTFNLKIHEPNIITSFKAGEPIAAFIPIPRYFADQFQLKDASTIFDKNIIDEENKANLDHRVKRNEVRDPRDQKNFFERDYFNGKDIYGNQFPDHQSSSGKKVVRE